MQNMFVMIILAYIIFSIFGYYTNVIQCRLQNISIRIAKKIHCN